MQMRFDPEGASSMLTPVLWGGGSGGVAYAAGVVSSIDPAAVKKFINNAGAAISSGTEACWDAYVQGYNIQQEAQLKETQAMLDGTDTVYNYLTDTEILDMGMNTFSTVQAARSFNKSLAYFLAPIPTAVDEMLGIRYALKGFYHLAKIIVEEFM